MLTKPRLNIECIRNKLSVGLIELSPKNMVLQHQLENESRMLGQGSS